MIKRKNLRLRDYNYKGAEKVYFITLCTNGKKSHFRDDCMAEMVVKEVAFRWERGEIKLFAYCIMPDHLHLLISLTEGYKRSLSDWVSAFKRYASRVAASQFKIKPLWQKNFYDHIVRKEESLISIAEYIINNPVRKGMVKEWKSYPYCGMVDDLPV